MSVANHNRDTFLTSLDPARVQIVEVHCPYCMIGTADVSVAGPTIITVGTQQTIDMRPKKCATCSKEFRIGFRQEFVGIQMEGE